MSGTACRYGCALTNMVRLTPDVAQVFPDADAVNAALREVIRRLREDGKTNPR